MTRSPILRDVLKYEGVTVRVSVPQMSDITPPAAVATPKVATNVSSGSMR